MMYRDLEVPSSLVFLQSQKSQSEVLTTGGNVKGYWIKFFHRVDETGFCRLVGFFLLDGDREELEFTANPSGNRYVGSCSKSKEGCSLVSHCLKTYGANKPFREAFYSDWRRVFLDAVKHNKENGIRKSENRGSLSKNVQAKCESDTSSDWKRYLRKIKSEVFNHEAFDYDEEENIDDLDLSAGDEFGAYGDLR